MLTATQQFDLIFWSMNTYGMISMLIISLVFANALSLAEDTMVMAADGNNPVADAINMTTGAAATEAAATGAVATEAAATEAPATEAVATEAAAIGAPATEAVPTEAAATEAVATEAPATGAATTEVAAGAVKSPSQAEDTMTMASASNNPFAGAINMATGAVATGAVKSPSQAKDAMSSASNNPFAGAINMATGAVATGAVKSPSQAEDTMTMAFTSNNPFAGAINMATGAVATGAFASPFQLSTEQRKKIAESQSGKKTVKFVPSFAKKPLGPPGSRPPVPPGFAPPGFAPPGFAPPGFAPPGFAPPGFAPPGFGPPRPPGSQPSCFIPGKLVPHRDCTKYRQCIRGQLQERQCNPGTVFDRSIGSCNLRSNVKWCGLRGRGKGRRRLGRRKPEVGGKCSGTETLPVKGECAAYLNCENKVYHLEYCPDGYFYDLKKKWCLFYKRVLRSDC